MLLCAWITVNQDKPFTDITIKRTNKSRCINLTWWYFCMVPSNKNWDPFYEHGLILIPAWKLITCPVKCGGKLHIYSHADNPIIRVNKRGPCCSSWLLSNVLFRPRSTLARIRSLYQNTHYNREVCHILQQISPVPIIPSLHEFANNDLITISPHKSDTRIRKTNKVTKI